MNTLWSKLPNRILWFFKCIFYQKGQKPKYCYRLRCDNKITYRSIYYYTPNNWKLPYRYQISAPTPIKIKF